MSLFPERNYICRDQYGCIIPSPEGAARVTGRGSRVSRNGRATNSHRYDGELGSTYTAAEKVRLCVPLTRLTYLLPC